MQEPCWYEEYPISICIVSNLVPLLLYVTGIYLLSLFSLVLVVLYLCFIIILELRLICRHCPDCYYYDKICAFGKGRLSSRICKKGISERFNQKTITWADIAPDFLVFLIPMVAGIMHLILGFSWDVVILVIILFILGFPGTALVRGKLACRYCKQREIGCPAEQLFDKPKKT